VSFLAASTTVILLSNLDIVRILAATLDIPGGTSRQKTRRSLFLAKPDTYHLSLLAITIRDSGSALMGETVT
jgi:hypothetical protein